MDCKLTRLLCPWDYPARILEWVPIRFWEFPDPGNKPASSALQAGSLRSEPPEENLSCEDDGQTQFCAVNWLLLVDFAPCVSLFSALSLLLGTLFFSLLLYISLISSVCYPSILTYEYVCVCVCVCITPAIILVSLGV